MKKQGQRWVNTIERTQSVADWVPFVSEIPAGSRAKYALDKVSGHLTLHRILRRSGDFRPDRAGHRARHRGQPATRVSPMAPP
jgi:inorganic pyrophosphatase